MDALSRALAPRVSLAGITLGRKGFLGYLKALSGGNVVKITPATGGASGMQAATRKGLKIVSGVAVGFLSDGEWITQQTPPEGCELRVSPRYAVKPNIGTTELAEALERILPFASTEDSRPILRCILFRAKEGKLTLASADGFRLSLLSLDYDEGEGMALIDRDDLRGISQALLHAKRARLSFTEGKKLGSSDVVLETECLRYRWLSVDGSYPEYEKLIPSEFKLSTRFDSLEALRVLSSLRTISDGKSFAVDLAIGDGKILFSNPDDKGTCEMAAETEGEGMRIRLAGAYLLGSLRACGGMVDMRLQNSYSSLSLSTDGYQVVLMPMMSPEAAKEAGRDREAKAREGEKAKAEAAPKPEAPPAPKPAKPAEAQAEAKAAVAEAEAITKQGKAREKPKKAEKQEKPKAKMPVAV